MIKVGVFQAQIDEPSDDYELAGFARRLDTTVQVGPKDLFVRIVWIDFNNDPLILIALDTLYFPTEISDVINEYCFQTHHIKCKNIIFNASHTHSAPNISSSFFGKISDEYRTHITNKIKEGIDLCKNNMVPSEITFKKMPIGAKIIGRRKMGRDIKTFFLKKRMLMLPNKERNIDDTIRVLQVSSNNNDIISNIVNFSCHPVFAYSQSISADFPGEISKRISDQLGGKTVFLQGYCGDIRPNYTTREYSIKSIVDSLKIIFNGEIFRKFKPSDYTDFCETIVSKVIKGNHKVTKITSGSNLRSDFFNYEIVSCTGRVCKNIRIKIANFDNIVIVSIPAEVNSRYMLELEKEFPDYNIIPLGFAEGVIGYLPFHDEIRDGGYEVNSAVNYGWDGPLDEKNLEKLFNDLKVIVQRVIDNNK